VAHAVAFASYENICYVLSRLTEENKRELMAMGTVWNHSQYALAYLLFPCSYVVLRDREPVCIFGAQRIGLDSWQAWMLETDEFDGLSWRAAKRGFKQVMERLLSAGAETVKVPVLKINADAARFCESLGASRGDEDELFISYLWKRVDLARSLGCQLT